MNLFILDQNPDTAARLQCDKHVVKMVVESAQMLSTAHRVLDGIEILRPSKSGKTNQKYWRLTGDREEYLYTAVHVGHPCTQWTMESTTNYGWHLVHFVALCDEYTYRYGKVHKSSELIPYLMELPRNIKEGPLNPFRLAMGSNPECMYEDDPVRSYREFYQTKQDRFDMNWTNRPIPEWFNGSQRQNQSADGSTSGDDGEQRTLREAI
jgi:hypothetical protein